MNFRKANAKRIKAMLLAAAMLSSTAALAPTSMAFAAETDPPVAAAATTQPEYNFAKALQYSIYFYDANMCGTGVSENNAYTWRGDCHTYDAEMPMNDEATNLSEAFLKQYADVLDPDGDGLIDVAGGFHDAGDHVKFGMPEAYSGATLGWGYYEFRDSYTKTGQDAHLETILRYFNDYFMKCTFRDASGEVVAFCYQVGDGDVDHAYWNSPEVDDMFRRGFFLTGDKPQTDYVASAAASLAINYLNFKDTDPEYAEQCLDYADALFDFAMTHEKELSDNGDGPKQYYKSSKWEDDYVWAAAWMYLCKKDTMYLEEAVKYLDYYAPDGWMYCWNDMWNGAACLLGEIDLQYPELDIQNMYRTAQGKTQYEDADCWIQVKKHLDGKKSRLTPGGYGFYDTWGSARYNTAIQFEAMIYDKYKNDGKPGEYSEWALGQMQYLMGNNPLNRCYIVGYSEISAKFPHHRAASGLTKCEDPDEHRYVLYGALVGGPNGKDEHNDITSDWIDNEVTIDYNAAFVGACAGLYEYYGDESMEITPNFPPPVNVDNKSGNSFWVDAYAVDDMQTSTKAGVTKLAMLVRTDSTSPKTDISVRYYFSVEELEDKANIANIDTSELYDQTSVEAQPYDGVITKPMQWNPTFDPNIYYFEVTWDGYKVCNSNKKYQCLVGFYYGDTWDPTNDWSYQGITKAKDTYQDGSEARTDYICVYSDGKLIGGIEPDGTKPEVPEESDTTTTGTTKATTTKTTTTKTQTATQLYGDVNDDKTVTIADVVMLARYVSQDSTLERFSETQVANADCAYDEQIDVEDISKISRFLAGFVKSSELGPQ